MTISSTTNRVVYTGNAVTTAFSFPYAFFAQADLIVVSTIIATGAQTTQALTTDYTISGSTDSLGHYSSGGTVTALVAPAATVTWTIYRDPAATQTTDLVANDALPAEALEAAFDYQTMLNQRTRDLVARSLRQPDGDSAALSAIPAKVARAGRLLGFDATTGDVAVTTTNYLADVATVAAIAANVTTVAGISANVTTVAGISANVTTVAGISADVTTVAGISASVTTVVGMSSAITTLNSNAANVTTVAGISANVTTVAGISANVTTVAGMSSAITTLNSNAANVNTVAGISANVTTVAGISANVTTVAGISADVTTNATNIVAIQGASANASSASSSASAAASSAAAAAASAASIATPIPVASGGTASTTAAAAKIALAVISAATGSEIIPSGTTAQRDASPAAGYMRFNTTTTSFEGYSGAAWAAIGGGSALSNDTSTATDIYPIFAAATSGTPTTVYTSNAKLLYKPSTGEFKATAPVALNGLVMNATAIATSYTIETGYNASSVGPVTIGGGVVITISSGQRWLVL